MSLSRSELNPLSVLGLRRLDFIPQHFSRITISKNIDIRLLDHWINFNLNSRYSLQRTIVLDKQRKMAEVIEIGIEDPKEILMLSLGCTHLHDINKEIK
jgi:hypothetical protein